MVETHSINIKKYWLPTITAFVPLSLGLGIYKLRSYIPHKNWFTRYVAYNLPDGLWMLSFCLLLFITIQDKGLPVIILWLLIPLLLSLILEFSQGRYIGGTFDWMDLASYVVFWSISLLFTLHKKFNSNSYVYENT